MEKRPVLWSGILPIIVAAFVLGSGNCFDQAGADECTEFTKKANQAVYKDPHLKWADQQDFEFATRGFIATDRDLVIKDAQGNVIWSNAEYDSFLKGDAPPTVNPSLWRHAVINALHGLFKVTDGIYQVRGQSASNMTIIEGRTGYIVIDPHISIENAKNNIELVFRQLGKKPVVAVIYSHSHIDHFGGVKGVTSLEDVNSGKTKIIAPTGFVKASLSENLAVGPAMGRRSMYMYGNLLEKSPKGQVDAGLVKTTEGGTASFIVPTDLIDEHGKTINLDGVELVFQSAPGEAPVNMHVYVPQKKTLYIADNCAHSLHNIYTIRGARTREATKWADSVDRALQFQDAEIIAAGHNWPRFGKDQVKGYLETQRDALKYVHDQTLRLMNKGHTPGEIANMIELPPSLAEKWYLRPYYGHIKHDVRGIYSLYLGWYDANPSHLDPLPPRETGKLMVEYMGGADAVISKAKEAFNKGQYRWVAQVLDYVVWAEPENMKARELAAAALTQLGYQTENGTWRNAYLTAAQELRQGIKKGQIVGMGPGGGLLADTPAEDFFDFLGIALNGPKAFGKRIAVNWEFTYTKKSYIMTLQNAVLHHREGSDPKADVTMSLTRDACNKLFTRQATAADLVTEGKMSVTGNTDKLRELFGLLDRFDFSFPIATHEPIAAQ